MIVGGHQRYGREGGDGRLADSKQVGVRTQRDNKVDDVLDVFVKAEAALHQRDIAGVGPVGDIDVVVGQQGAHRAAQERGEVAGHWRDHQHARLFRRAFFCKMQQRAERRGKRDVLDHAHAFSVHFHRVDGERAPAMRKRRKRQQVACGPQ